MARNPSIKRAFLKSTENKCAICSLPPYWNSLPLTLHLDHIDGTSSNNHISNLRLLCPNCHSQTSTYGGRNKTKPRKKRKSPYEAFLFDQPKPPTLF